MILFLKKYCIGWNVGNARPDQFEQILPARGGAYDIIALGLQEATWSTKEDPNASEDENSYKQLQAELAKCLCPEFDLVCVYIFICHYFAE